MHLLRAESSGPQVGKIVSKMKVTTRILYLIYLGLTLLEIVILMLDKPIAGYEGEKFFFSLLATFGCAGTGGFGFIPGSMELFSAFSQYVMATFMLLFGINFGIYYLLLIGNVRSALKSEELRTYLLIIVVAVSLVFLGLVGNIQEVTRSYTGEEAFRHSFFQVASLLTTTGFTTTDYQLWPTLSASVLLLLMFIGGMAGSTAGGIKVSRVMIAVKGLYINVRKLINPRYIPKAKFEGKTLSESTISGVFLHMTFYFLILLLVTLVLGFDPVGGEVMTVVSDGGSYEVKHGVFSNFTAAYSCLSNIGPGFEAVGPYASFAAYSGISKIVLLLTMLVGRLEILPVFVLFSAKTWKNS